ncbi:glycosyltransferase family 90 protein [Calocera cornea HHB12733]|uniref:Glycosyltransferase family 90 protein n=1 Tax=Calocera cornea HHB12733 TaxID=1353952 RepID=A0A165EVZ4_9BASI|nr:glycosyltransferase family 90 protein [Calocera cornea HHB12733]
MLFSRRYAPRSAEPLVLTDKRKRRSAWLLHLVPFYWLIKYRRYRRLAINLMVLVALVAFATYRAFPSETKEWLDRVEVEYAARMPNLPSLPSLPAIPLPAAFTRHAKHPIEKLMEDGRRKWEDKLRRQSKSLEQAVAEYQRRYGLAPPKGFDKWYEYATRNGFQLVDEFDAIHEDLAPFRRLSSVEVQSRTRSAAKQETMFSVAIKDGLAKAGNEVRPGGTKKGDMGRAKGFVQTLQGFVHDLPDMVFAVSGLAESSVYPTWEVSQPQNFTPTLGDAQHYVSKSNEFPVWYKYTNTCAPADPVRTNPTAYEFPPATTILPPTDFDAVPTEGAVNPFTNFLHGTEWDLDFCTHPEKFYQFGHFYAGWPMFNETFPVFGPGRGPRSMDIRIPSYYYVVPLPKYTYGFDPVLGHGQDDDPNDPEWDEKSGTMFWRGATTGGGSSPQGRYSLVQLAGQDNPTSQPILHRTGHGLSESWTETRIDVNSLRTAAMDVGFTKAVQCAPYKPGGCDGMMRDYTFVDKVPLYEAYKSKILLDLDGMGYSARSMALLASKSALVKSTIYREFFDDWLQPWVHFIPLSSTFEELFNIWAFFVGVPAHLVDPTLPAAPAQAGDVFDPKGDAALRSIADSGRSWKREHARIVDMEVYTYRLCLEWARLWYQDEQEMDFVLDHPLQDDD